MRDHLDKIVEKFNDAHNKIILQSSDLSLESISLMVDSGSIDIDPDFQRRERWSPEAQVRLVESFLLNLPVPPVYFSEGSDGKYTVIDGKQRIISINKFIKNNLKLIGLEKFSELEGFNYDQLPEQIKVFLKIKPAIRVISVLRQSDVNAKYEVFDRLNTTGYPLFPQEIRNSLYRGALNNLIHELADNSFFKQQLKILTGKEDIYRSMQDAELVLRFFMLSDNWRNFNGNMRKSLDEYMQSNTSISTSKINELRNKFLIAIDRCNDVYKENAFKCYLGTRPRNQFMSALFDSEMIVMSMLSDAEFIKILQSPVETERKMHEIFEDTDFSDSIRTNTNTAAKVSLRIEKLYSALVK